MFSRSNVGACVRIFPWILAVPCAAQSWSEARVVELFARQSPQAMAARTQVAVARETARSRTLYANPSFSYSREGAGFTEFFQAEQTLPLNRRIGILRQAIAPTVAVAEAEADALVWQLRADLRQAFYRLVVIQERQAVQNATLADLQEVVRILAAREKEGEGSRFDRLRGDREMVEIRAELAVLDARAAQARARMLEFLPPGTQIAKVEGSVVPGTTLPGLAELVSRAAVARSEIRADNFEVERLRLEEQAANRLRYPEPVVSAGLKRADVTSFPGAGLEPRERTQNGAFIGITIPIPSFN